MWFIKRGAVDKVIAGLGNPGKEYEGTRHNCGFMTADCLARLYGAPPFKAKFRGAVTECSIGGKKVLLLKPMTYMNLSGESIAECLRFYKLGAESLIAVYDDCALPVGKLRVRAEGSAGGHNGVKNIIARVNTKTFDRVRIGIGEKPEKMDLIDYVTSKFTAGEREEIELAAPRAAEAAALIVTEGAVAAMNRYNGTDI